MAIRVKPAKGTIVGSGAGAMKELLRTNDVVRLSWIRAVLGEAGVDSLILDRHTSIVEGSLGAIPCRLVVADGDYLRAMAALHRAEADIA